MSTEVTIIGAIILGLAASIIVLWDAGVFRKR